MNKLSRSFRLHRKLAIGLLLLALVSTASALVYYSLNLRTVVTSTTPKVVFVTASDSTAAGATIGTNSTYAKLTGIKSYPNATSIYEQALNVSNTDTAAHSIRLRSISITSGFASYGTILVKLTDTTGTLVTGQTITYTGGGSWSTTGSPTGFQSLAASTKWSIRIESTLNAGVAAGVTTTIEIAVDVQ